MRLSSRRVAGLVVVVVASMALSVCGGGGDSPAIPPTQPSVPTVPTPTPAPTAEPPISASCAKLAAGAADPGCSRGTPDFQDQVDAAIRTLQREQPQIFSGDVVLSVGAYYVGLIKVLDREGLCADTNGEELGVARSAGYNEQYDVLTARSEARFGPSSYRTTCSPSGVPLAKAGMLPPPAGCSLPSSREVACGREPEGQYYLEVEAAIKQLMKDKPELFDFGQNAPGTDNPKVTNLEAYHQGVADILTKKGYCALAGTEEVGVKKGSNAFSEQYDINVADQYVRTGPSIYRVSCYPAAF